MYSPLVQISTFTNVLSLYNLSHINYYKLTQVRQYNVSSENSFEETGLLENILHHAYVHTYNIIYIWHVGFVIIICMYVCDWYVPYSKVHYSCLSMFIFYKQWTHIMYYVHMRLCVSPRVHVYVRDETKWIAYSVWVYIAICNWILVKTFHMGIQVLILKIRI